MPVPMSMFRVVHIVTAINTLHYWTLRDDRWPAAMTIAEEDSVPPWTTKPARDVRSIILGWAVTGGSLVEDSFLSMGCG